MVCPSGAWFENRPHLMPSICLAWNPKHVIVQWVGIGTHTFTVVYLKLHYQTSQEFTILCDKISKTNEVTCNSALGEGICHWACPPHHNFPYNRLHSHLCWGMFHCRCSTLYLWLYVLSNLRAKFSFLKSHLKVGIHLANKQWNNNEQMHSLTNLVDEDGTANMNWLFGLQLQYNLYNPNPANPKIWIIRTKIL